MQLYKDFRENVPSTEFGEITPCMKGAYTLSNVRSVFPEYIGNSISEGIEAFGKKIPGFDRDDALLSGVESRTSSPVRILRNKEMESEKTGNLSMRRRRRVCRRHYFGRYGWNQNSRGDCPQIQKILRESIHLSLFVLKWIHWCKIALESAKVRLCRKI